ncbi:hypothetical protein ACFPTO_01520 [Paraburkholderia denitrificans]|uniref:Uncharacterized protein n=1 Tax=Paraburkholderia denitrificans TaxID=694025 RepID=A0ABW0J398_9BURK
MKYAIIIFVISLVMGFHNQRKLDRLEKYEFEHRTDGGVVGFSSYKDAKRHSRKKESAVSSMSLWSVLAAMSLLAILAIWGWGKLATG